MTDTEIIELSDQLGLHADHDDDPENEGEESIYLWHDADESVDGGLLITFCDGRAQLADLKSWGDAGRSVRRGRPVRDTDDAKIRSRINVYAERWNALPQSPPEPMNTPTKKTVRRAVVTRPAEARQVISQRKEGAFKAIDPLGHHYYVEIFREIGAEKSEGPRRLVTIEGESVEWIAKGQYRLVNERIDLASDDPTAP